MSQICSFLHGSTSLFGNTKQNNVETVPGIIDQRTYQNIKARKVSFLD